MDAWLESHMQPDYDLKAFVPKQGPIIPPLKACPVFFQCIGEAEPFLAIDRKLDDLGALELHLLSGGFESLLRQQLANGGIVVNLGTLLAFAPTRSIRIRGLYGLFRVRWAEWLKHVVLAPLRGKQRRD